MDDVLNQAQRSALSIVLRRFEEQLRQTEQWLKGTDETGTMRQAAAIFAGKEPTTRDASN